MTEIIPTEGDSADIESFIGLLKQNDAIEGVVSNEINLYEDILGRWRDKEITDTQAKDEALAISASRGVNYH